MNETVLQRHVIILGRVGLLVVEEKGMVESGEVMYVRKCFLEEKLVSRVCNEKREPSVSRFEGKDF